MKLTFTQQKHIKRLSKNELYKAYIAALQTTYELQQVVKKLTTPDTNVKEQTNA